MANLKSTVQNENLKDNNVKSRAYHFALSTIAFTNDLPNKRTYWIITDQLIRACTSIGANLIEAQSSSSRREFIKFYEIALKSCNETKFWLALTRDTADSEKTKVDSTRLLEEASEISRMIGASILTLKGKRF